MCLSKKVPKYSSSVQLLGLSESKHVWDTWALAHMLVRLGMSDHGAQRLDIHSSNPNSITYQVFL